MGRAPTIGRLKEWSIGHEVFLAKSANTCDRGSRGGPCRWDGRFVAVTADFQYRAGCRLGLQPDRLDCDDLRADGPSAGAKRGDVEQGLAEAARVTQGLRSAQTIE